ncbi:MAG: hypothetical protein AB7E55_04035 [Pigmentiphaga sp.]
MTCCKAMGMTVPLLELSTVLWESTLMHLRQEGAGVRESGGFLLGTVQSDVRVATHFLPYEHLQSDALQADFVQLSAASFSRLWDYCAGQALEVVADVHTHRYGAGQSRSDSENPMLALAGHLALIIPNFAQGPVQLEDLGLYVYQGSHRWQRFRGPQVAQLIRLNTAEAVP